jgi:hypothetical protein
MSLDFGFLIRAKEKNSNGTVEKERTFIAGARREGKGIAKGVAKELLSIGTLGLYRPTKRGRKVRK